MASAVIIIGAGGHAAVVADALLASGQTVLGFTDRDRGRHGLTICGRPVLGDDGVLADHDPASVSLANGLGVTGTPRDLLRQARQEALSVAGWRFVMVRHPASIVSAFAAVDSGAQLFALSVVQAGAHIGVGAIVNTSAVVEHDVTVGAWTHIAPGAIVCGNVRLGERSLIGAGAVIRQGLIIGSDCLVGAGAVVVKSVADHSAIAGVPASPLPVRI
jgi:sugar O-acyltransferase (sialic acid O-acetyltransferase NeuD family)